MTSGNGRTVLLVEDDHSVRKLIASILDSRGYAVLPAANGAEALALSAAHEGDIHLIVTDFGLGEMNGLELAARVAGTRPGVAILIISGYTELPLPPGLKDAVRTEFLSKPFTMEVLLAKVSRMMDGAGSPGVPGIKQAG